MDCKAKVNSNIVYMTTGVLLQILIHKKYEADFTHICLDEVHNRDVWIDLVLLVIKKMQLERPSWDVKIILLSATINVQEFEKYFDHTTVESITVPNTKRVYRIDNYYIEDMEKELVSFIYYHVGVLLIL
jgi:HrpA-like RNA helicase